MIECLNKVVSVESFVFTPMCAAYLWLLLLASNMLSVGRVLLITLSLPDATLGHAFSLEGLQCLRHYIIYV